MNLRSGVRLGPYEIVAPIGAGGMGEVYKATDTRLARTVAIKILPAEFSSDARLKIRFEREAKTVSSLNHPHICGLYDVGENYLVMEFCEGQTLAQRLERGALSLDQTLEYGIQIAEALDKAHRSGIIHRDLKPSNIMITKSGVKLLDFGLAKEHGAAVVTDGSRTTTVNKPLTEEGTLVGTVQYMAPETIAHGVADARSDIFALGLVLYEMLTGKPAFHEDSRAKLIAAILEREPPAPTREVEPRLAHLLSRCLEKTADARWQTAADIAAELRWIRRGSLEPPAQPWRFSLPWRVTAILIAVALGVGAIALIRNRPVSQPRRTFAVMIETPPLYLRSGAIGFALSPAATAYVAGVPPRLYLRHFSDPAARAVAGGEGAQAPFFSPDGQWLGFVADGKLKKVRVTGGDDPQVINDEGNYGRPAWSDKDLIVFARAGAIYTVAASGGPAIQVTRPKDGAIHSRPSVLPGGETVLINVVTAPSVRSEDREISLLNLASGAITTLIKGGVQPVYAPNGHLVFAKLGPLSTRRATIFAVPFDPQRARVTGRPKPVVSGVAAYPLGATAYWTMSTDGTLAYVPHDPAFVERELVWLDESGRATPATPRRALYRAPSLSPDGKRVAYSDLDNLWVGDLDRDVWTSVARGGDYVEDGLWSPDGATIVFQSLRDGTNGLYAVPADGGAAPVLLMRSDRQPRISAWSPDGRYLAFDRDGGTGRRQDIWVLEIATGQATPLIATPERESTPSFSPDGRWIAFDASPDPYASDIYVQRFGAAGPRHTVYAGAPCGTTTVCWNVPRWSAAGKELYFRSGTNRMMSVPIDTSSGLVRIGKPRVLFEADLSEPFDVAPAGRRFLVPRTIRQPRWDHVNILTGWANE